MAAESAAAALNALDLKARAMALQDVLHDRKPETRASCPAGAAGIDAIEALGEARDVLARNADAGVRDREMCAIGIDPPAHVDRAVDGGVLRYIVHQVGESRMDLGLVAEERGARVDAHAYLTRVLGACEHVLAQHRQQRGDIDRYALDF